MSWGFIDDGFWCHAKVAALDELGPNISAQATGLWVRALSYCKRYDPKRGTITIAAVRRIVPWRPKRAIAALVSVGLWHVVVPGKEWRFHDWKHYASKRSAGESGPESDSDSHTESATESHRESDRESHTSDPQNHSEKDTHLLPTTNYPVKTPTVVVGLLGGSELPARDPDPPPRPPPESNDELQAETARRLKRAWSNAWLGRTAQPASPAHLSRVAQLAPWLTDYARRTDRSAPDLAAPLIEAFFAAKAKCDRPRLEWLEEDPGRYLDAQRRQAERDAAQAERRSYRQYLDDFEAMFERTSETAARRLQ